MKGRADYIIPECYVDTNLVETLVCNDGCNHHKGCNNVAKVMQTKFAQRFAIGIIDADKRRPGYLAEFVALASSAHLTLYRHLKRKHYIILVSPAVDTFILACAGSAGVKMEDFGLPSKLMDFTEQAKKVMSNKDKRFKRLFRASENSAELQLLKSVLTYLADNPYNADESILIGFFTN